MTVDRRRRLLATGAAVALLVGGVAWLVFGRGSDESDNGPASAGVSLGRLKEIAAGISHPVYWTGPQPGMQDELTRTEGGRVYIRYLPKGTDVGTSRADFLTVGTYPQARAFETLKATARKQGVATIRLDAGGLAFRDRNRPSSVYAAYPASDFQIEVFQPSGDRALRLVRAGRLVPLVRPASVLASVAELRALPARVGHPVYWAGGRADTRYELTGTKDGRVYIRYLPPGAGVGSSSRYLTIGTYPQSNPFANVKTRAAKLE